MSILKMLIELILGFFRAKDGLELSKKKIAARKEKARESTKKMIERSQIDHEKRYNKALERYKGKIDGTSSKSNVSDTHFIASVRRAIRGK